MIPDYFLQFVTKHPFIEKCCTEKVILVLDN